MLRRRLHNRSRDIPYTLSMQRLPRCDVRSRWQGRVLIHEPGYCWPTRCLSQGLSNVKVILLLRQVIFIVVR